MSAFPSDFNGTCSFFQRGAANGRGVPTDLAIFDRDCCSLASGSKSRRRAMSLRAAPATPFPWWGLRRICSADAETLKMVNAPSNWVCLVKP
eukprot:6139749-Pyramimonas_sp.AAC.1